MTEKLHPSVLAARRRKAIVALEAAVKSGARCPTNDEIGSGILPAFAHEGLIKVEVFARNYRVVTFCKGELAGKSTALPPSHYGPAYRVIAA